MKVPDLEEMIVEEQSKVEFDGYVGFSGELVETGENGEIIVVGRIDIGSVIFGNVMRVTHAYPNS